MSMMLDLTEYNWIVIFAFRLDVLLYFKYKENLAYLNVLLETARVS